MTDQPTPHRLQTAIDSVAASAALVLKMKGPEQRSLWRRLLPGRGERRTRHRARRFIGALDQVLMSQASLLSAEQLDEIRRHVDAVIDRMEDEIRLNPPSSREGAAMATIIYKTRARFEGIMMAVERAKRQVRPGHL